MSQELIDTVKKGITTLDEKYQAKFAEMQAALIDNAQHQQNGAGMSVKTGPSAGSLQRAIEGDAGLKAYREGRSKEAMLAVEGGVGMLLKSTLVGDVQSSTTDLYPVQPQRAPGIYNDVRQPLRLIEAMPRMPVQSGSFEYVALDAAYTDDADYQVQQGDAKAQTALPMELLSANIATVATTLPCSEQVLADQPALAQFIGSKLSYQVLLKLEQEIINGTGGTGKIDGLLSLGAAFVASSNADTVDGIGEAIAELQSLGWNPGAVLLHPRTFQHIRSIRVDSGNGEYLAGGWATPAAPSIWNVPVILTPAMPTTKAVVMDVAQTMLLDRQSVSFQFGYVNNQFVQNLRTARAECRAGLMVAAPSAVQVMSLD
jgi:HK97 family phage major capsid protein